MTINDVIVENPWLFLAGSIGAALGIVALMAAALFGLGMGGGL